LENLEQNTNYDLGEGYANTKLKIAGLFKLTKEKSHDGYMLTTKNWVGEGNYRNKKYQATGSDSSVNIDDILGAFNAAGRSGNITKGTSLDQALSYLNGLAQEVYDKTPSPQEKKVCNNCGKVLEGKEIGTHNTLGEGVRDVDTPKK
jgi:hypothetical protein